MKDLNGEEQVKNNAFDMLRGREDISEADLEKELNFKTAVKGFNKKEVADYISELNRGFQVAQASLTGRVSQLSDEVAVLKYERERNVKTIHDLKVQLAGGENNIDESYFFDKYKSDVDTLKNEKAYLKKQSDDILEKYEAVSKDNATLKQEMKSVINERDKLAADCDELRDQSVLLNSKIKELSSQVDDLSGQNKSLLNEKDKLVSENSSLQEVETGADNRINEIQAEKAVLAEKAEQMASEIAALEAKLKSVTEEVNLAKDEKAGLENKLNAAEEGKADLERKLAAAKEGKEVGLRTLKQEIGKLTREKAEAEKKIEELKNSHDSEVSTRSYELDELKAAYEKLEDKIRIGDRAKEIQLNAKAREIMSLKKENAELKEKLEGMTASDVNQLGTENAVTKTGLFGKFGLSQKGKDVEVASLRDEVTNLKQANMELSSQLTKVKKSKETEYNTLNKMIAGLRQENIDLSSKLEEVSDPGTSDALDAEQFNRLMSERDTLLEQNGGYQKKIQILEIQLKEAENRVLQTVNSVLNEASDLGSTELLEQNRILTAKIEQLQSKNEELVENLNQKKDEIYDLRQIISVDKDTVQTDEKPLDNDDVQYLNGVDRRLNNL